MLSQLFAPLLRVVREAATRVNMRGLRTSTRTPRVSACPREYNDILKFSLECDMSEESREWSQSLGDSGAGPGDSAREARRASRAQWPVRKFRLAEEPGPDLSATTTASERLAMMWPLARDAWTLAGRAIPDYPRDRMPVRVVRPAGDRSSD